MEPADPSRPWEPAAPTPPPPRAFTQGVGTVFQFAGVLLFLTTTGVCCGSGLLSKEVAQRKDWSAVGWGRWTDRTDPAAPVERVVYSANAATATAATVGVVLGIALAGHGLGMQAQRRRAPAAAVVVTAAGTLFWLVHLVFFVQKLHSPALGVIAFALAAGCGLLCALAVAAAREMRADPPPAGYDLLPADYKVPYSHYHQDPPEVRLARELDERRARLAVQRKELEMLEARVKRAAGERRTDDPPASG